MTPDEVRRPGAADVLCLLESDGMLLQSAKGPIPNLVDLVAGEPVRGSWWAHPRSHEIFAVINEVHSSPDVVALRLVRGKVTLVHRHVWPALVRLAAGFPPGALAAVDEEHTASGAHRRIETPFPDWVGPDAVAAGECLAEEDALAMLPECLR